MAKVLLVDDEPEIRFITNRMLSKAGHKVIEVEDAEEAKEELKNEKPDLILLDVMLPGLKGWEFCKQVKGDEKLKQIPVVMFTVRTSPDSISRSKECGADEHINKPFDREELLRVVSRFTE